MARILWNSYRTDCEEFWINCVVWPCHFDLRSQPLRCSSLVVSQRPWMEAMPKRHYEDINRASAISNFFFSDFKARLKFNIFIAWELMVAQVFLIGIIWTWCSLCRLPQRYWVSWSLLTLGLSRSITAYRNELRLQWDMLVVTPAATVSPIERHMYIKVLDGVWMNASRLLLPHLPLQRAMSVFAAPSCHQILLWFLRNNVTRCVLDSPRISVCSSSRILFFHLADEFVTQVVVKTCIRSILQV